MYHPLKKRAFVHPLLVATLTLIGTGGSAGLGAVWMRHEISETARHTQQMEQQLAALQRNLAETGAQIAVEQSDGVLARNAEWGLGLVPPLAAQVVIVSAADQQLHAAQHARPFSDAAPVLAALLPDFRNRPR